MVAPEMFVGCCGAYCRTCRAFVDGTCRGCKLGYGDGKRDISRCRCRIKVCCFVEKKLMTCADCNEYASCMILQEFHNKRGYKYKRYRQSIEYIREHGYEKFIKKAAGWTGAYGRLD